MQVIKSTKIIYCDLDDTLLIPNWQQYFPSPEELVLITNKETGHAYTFMIHNRHIELLKQFKARGHTIVVWSQGGFVWAENAIKTLKLENVIDVCMAKPDWYIDDLPAKAFMPHNIYMHPTDPSQDKKHYDADE